MFIPVHMPPLHQIEIKTAAITADDIEAAFSRETLLEEFQEILPQGGTFAKPRRVTCTITVGNVQVVKKDVALAVCISVAKQFGVKPHISSNFAVE